MVCVGIYAVLVNNITVADNLQRDILPLPPMMVILSAFPCSSPAHLQSQFRGALKACHGAVEIFRAKRRKYDPTLTREEPIE